VQTAKWTLQVTAQLGVRAINDQVQCRFQSAMPHLQYPHLMQMCWYTDSLFFSVKLIRSFKCPHLNGNGIMGFAKITPMKSKADPHLSLLNSRFIKEHGVMENLVIDGHSMMVVKEWRQTVQQYQFNHQQRTTAPYSLWQKRLNWM
jgi:hypothetical protein